MRFYRGLVPPTGCFGFDNEHRDPAYELFKPYPTVYYVKAYLVDGLEHVLFLHILEIVIPIDFHLFQRNHQPVTSEMTMIDDNLIDDCVDNRDKPDTDLAKRS